MIPLKDENPTRTTPVVTLLLIAACILTWFFVQNPDPLTAVVGPQTEREAARQQDFTYRRAAVPCEVVTGQPLSQQEAQTGDCTRNDTTREIFPAKGVFLALLTSMFLHGSLIHLGGNMLYLWVFGNNIEDTMGKPPYLVFYLLSGVVGTLAHIALQPSSTIPLVGASGAIAGVMGAYLVIFPRVPIRSLIIFVFILFRDVEARWLLGIWFVSQFFINPNSGVAWAAHVGGFVFGVLGGLFWRGRRQPEAVPQYYAPYR
ncbi:MAG: rhomboid family intramembrane serine protease [Actinobacteria bacterium]|nr:rhomboid family intramembrane serine protease [Actinomycetota bacterium]